MDSGRPIRAARCEIPQVMENLIARKQMPVTIGIFISPGQRGEVMAYGNGNNPNTAASEYDSLGDKYARFIVEEMPSGSRQEI